MTGTTPRVLLLDDGELCDVAAVLEELDLPFTRLRGGQIPDQLSPPLDLLIATPRRASVVRRGSPPGAPLGHPIRIIAVEEDSNAMRRMLRRMGFHLLVRRPTEAAVWRLLIHRALYRGVERRSTERVAMGSEVRVTSGRTPRKALLLDISNRGCRLRSKSPFHPGAQLSMEIGTEATGGRPLVLRGQVGRSVREPGSQEDEASHGTAILFDASLDEATRYELARLLNTWASGAASLAVRSPGGSSVPPCESHEIPGLTLDDETDPAITANVEVEVSIADGEPLAQAESRTPPERRHQPRGAYSEQVLAFGEQHSRVLLGRDLSVGGMRVEPLPDLAPGDRFRLVIYGPARSEPTIVRAEVTRDDGESGMALRFLDVGADVAERLEKLVACLPDVESLEGTEAERLGAVVSEILDD